MPAYQDYGGYFGGGGYDLYSVVQSWEDAGVYDVILPFLLIFVFTFATLQKMNLFGPNSKNVNVVVAAIMGLLFLRNPFLIYVTRNFLSNTAFAMVIVLAMLMMFGIFGFTSAWTQGGWRWFGIGIPILIVFWSLFRDLGGHSWELLGWWANMPPGIKSSLIPILIFIVVIGFAIRGSPAALAPPAGGGGGP